MTVLKDCFLEALLNLKEPLKKAMQNGQNSVAGSEATTGGMSGIIGIVLKSVTGNGD